MPNKSCVLASGAVLLALAAAALFESTSAATADPLFWPAPVFDLTDPLSHMYAPRKRIRHSYPKMAETPKDIAKPHYPLIIVISIENQHLKIYDGNGLFAEAPVSTGMRGHSTPMGVFSIVQKSKWHRSNLYSAAPMPYMQRITWSGVALHAGVLPGYPASHGCIRLPMAFATRLWSWSKLGARVIIAPGEMTPADIAHPLLITHPIAASASLSSGKPVDVSGQLNAVTTASSDLDHAELRLTSKQEDAKTPFGSNDRVRIANAESPAASSRTEAGNTGALSTDNQGQPASDGKDALPNDIAPKPQIDALNKRAGHIAVFISGKEKRLYVRQNFEPLFDMPVTIAEDRRPLGTHVFTARGDDAEPDTYRWSVVSLPTASIKMDSRAEYMDSRRKRFARSAAEMAPSLTDSAIEALDRLKVPDDAIAKISSALASGGSMIISDQGLGDETGLGTDFIVPLR